MGLENNTDPIEGRNAPLDHPDITKKSTAMSWFIIIGILTFTLIVVIGMAVYVNSPSRKYKKQLKLAELYLNELEYDKAFACYQAAIELSPKNPEAYELMAELYLSRDDKEAAIDVLKNGVENTDNEDLIKFLAEVEENNEIVSSMAEPVETDIVENKGEITESVEDVQEEEIREESVPTPEPTNAPTPTEAPSATPEPTATPSPTPVDESSGWKQAYRDIVQNNYDNNNLFTLIYIDDDDIPELIAGYAGYDGYDAYTYYNNTAVKVCSEPLGHIQYIPKSGLSQRIYYELGPVIYDIGQNVYKLENGVMSMIWSGNCEYDRSTGTLYNFTVFGNPVTKEEFYSSYRSCCDGYQNEGQDVLYSYSKTDMLTQLR